ncbi:MAG: hypothetical protein MK066_11435 [Crocinitomicaceae bacterium]|nr:hypothetical protein [Crocinitomicaceae bacterium]
MKKLLLLAFLFCTPLLFGQEISGDSNTQEPEEVKDPFIRNRVYSEAGMDMLSTQNGVNVGLKYKIGANIYFINYYAYGFGINISILNGGLSFLGNPAIHGSLPSIGPSLLLRTQENAGFEFNLNGGYGGFLTENTSGSGFTSTFDAKWRKEEFTIGLSYSLYFDSTPASNDVYDVFSLNLGWEFSIRRFGRFAMTMVNVM